MFFNRIINKLKSIKNRKKITRHTMVGSPGLWQMKRNFQIEFLKEQGLEPDHIFLDIGCGTMRGGIPILRYLNSSHYYGIDIREVALVEAKAEVTEEKLDSKNPNLILFDDFSKLNIDEKFDMIWAFSVIIHLEDSITDKCFEFISRHLKPNGHFYANVNIGDGMIGNWQEFPVMGKQFEFYESLATKYGLKIKKLGPLSQFGHHSGVENQDSQEMLEFSLN